MTAQPDDGRRRRRQVTAAVGVGAFLVRLPALGRPRVLVFDELFYAPDAADLLRWGTEHAQPAHPPLGKWLIAVGIQLFGFTPVGWRFAAVVAGALIAAIACWTAIRITDRLDAGIVAGSLVALDGLVHTTSRLALLDIFVALATTAALGALVAAWRSQPDARRAGRAWWWAAGALSAGAAVKWSVLAMAPLVVCVGWILAHRLLPPGRPRRRAQVLRVLGMAVLPVIAVLVSVAPRQLGPDPTSPAGYWHEQAGVLDYHRTLQPTNSNAAPAWHWVLQTHPTIAYRSDGGGHAARLVIGANPVVWLVGLVGIGWALVAAFRRNEMLALLLGAVASMWLPWLFLRASYSFYAVVVVPPMVLCYVASASSVAGRWRRMLLWVPVGAAAVGFVVLWPIWSAQPLSPDAVDLLTSWPGWSR